MKKSSVILLSSCVLALGACSKEEEIPVEPEIEQVETSEEDALADAIENAESAADAMGQEISDATAAQVEPPAEDSDAASQETSENAGQ